MEEAFKSKFEGSGDQGKASKLFSIRSISNDHSRKQLEFYNVYGRTITIQSHLEGTSDPTIMNLKETLRSMQQLIKGLARQFQSVAIDVEELKRVKSSATMEKRLGNNFGEVNSPHHQRPYDNMSTQGYHDMSVHNPYPFHEGGYQGRPQARGGRQGG
ncbi:hypothetical protein M9H77_22844 [Catharanthus roseus]|uniref:Uncharacterized protein n=1 Tax=Catharanthus roseus TaxID=4058 RepID=A0ACC0AS06_CATRO|nr:hypothetical protein M9H77_22844 [Catharanthus roseus]